METRVVEAKHAVFTFILTKVADVFHIGEHHVVALGSTILLYVLKRRTIR